MAGEITRLMVEVAVTQGLKGMKQQFDRRILRNAVEHGGRFSKGRSQKETFQVIQEMLRTEDHPYFELCRHVVNDVDEAYLMNYVINLAYEGWTQGAATIRRLEKEEACSIPWCMTVFTSQDGQHMAMDTVKQLIEQGRELGIAAYILYEEDARGEELRRLCDSFSTCAFTLFLPDEKITDGLLDELQGVDNAAIVAMQASGTFTSCEKLQAHHRLYGLCREVDGAAMESLMKQKDLRIHDAPNAAVLFYHVAENSPQDVAKSFSDFLWEQKRYPTYPIFPIDLPGDLSYVDQIVSGKDCQLAIAPDGTYLTGRGESRTDKKFPETSLHDAVKMNK